MNQNHPAKLWLESEVSQKEVVMATRQSVIRLIFFNPDNALLYCYHPHLLMRIVRPREYNLPNFTQPVNGRTGLQTQAG